MKLPLLILTCALVGCATCQRHPVICSAAGILVAGSIAASIHHERRQPHQVTCTPVPHGDVELPPSGGERVCR